MAELVVWLLTSRVLVKHCPFCQKQAMSQLQAPQVRVASVVSSGGFEDPRIWLKELGSMGRSGRLGRWSVSLKTDFRELRAGGEVRSRQQTWSLRPPGQRIGMKKDLFCTRIGFLMTAELKAPSSQI